MSLDFIEVEDTSLQARMENSLEKLSYKAREDGKYLIKTKGIKNIFVGIAYEHIKLKSAVINVLASNIYFTKKYQVNAPKTVLELIYACHGLNNTINKLQAFQDFNLEFYSDDIVDDIDTIERELVSAKSRTFKRIPSTEELPLSFCALCWKRVFISDFYCKDHLPGRNRDQYKKAKNKLFTALKTTVLNEELSTLYNNFLNTSKRNKNQKVKKSLLAHDFNKLTARFAPKIPTYKIFKNNDGTVINNNSAFTANENETVCENIAQSIIEYYPQTAEKLRLIFTEKMTSELQYWVIQIVDELDKKEAIMWRNRDHDSWIGSVSPETLISSLLHMLRRHESFLIIQSAKPKYGPEKGRNANLEIRNGILKIVEKQMREMGKVNQSEIAKEIGVSRQRISVLIKELALETRSFKD